MKFKSLHVQGFKSFVDKTDILFPGGLTCVVGPNGSGKSNILDAIRWVFGEQNAKELRGSGMEDIIFSGSANRKAYGFAEVTLTLSDLSEEITSKWGTLSEVAVTRKYYRTGEREYRINNNKCRLKDIREIFYDAGIGPRSISIIEQGKVDKIINSSPEELRQFFEETAGVIKFKERKKEAERRLNQTKDNLSRVHDIIVEVSDKMEVLQGQVESVKKYKELKSRRDILSTSLMYFKYSKLINDLKELDSNINEEKVALASLAAKSSSYTEIELTIESKIASLREELKKINTDIVGNTDRIGEVNGDIRVIQNDLDSSEKTKEELHFKIEDYEKKLRIITEKRVEILGSNADLEEKYKELQHLMDEASGKMEELGIQREDINDDLMEAEHAYLSLAEKGTKIRNRIFECETVINSLESGIERMKKEKESASAELENAEKDGKDLSERKERLSTEFEILEEKVLFLSNEYEDASELSEELEKDLSESKLQLRELNSRISMLKGQLDSFTAGDKGSDLRELNPVLLIDKYGLDGIASVEFGDVLLFNDADYDKVMGFMDSYEGSLRFAFKNELDIIKASAESIEQINEKVIKNSGIYRKLGKDDRGVMIASVLEELLSCESSVGFVKDKVESLELEVEEQREKVTELSSQIDIYKDEKADIQFELRNIEKDYKDKRAEYDRLRKRTLLIESEIERDEQNRKNSLNEIDKLRAEADVVNEEAALRGAEKEDFESKMEELEILYNDAKDELSVLKIEERGAVEKISSVKKELHFIDRDIAENTRGLASSRDRLSRLLTVDLINLKDRLEKRKGEIAELVKKKEVLEQSKGRLEHDYEMAEKELEDARFKYKDISQALKDSENSLNALQMKKSRFESDISNVKENFYEQFASHVEDQDIDLTDFDNQSAKSELENVKRGINNLGPLHMGAEQEYDEISERHEFLEKQKADLEGAVEAIHELIREMDDSTIMLFKDTFDGVKDNFSKVFSILFGEGQCDLKLSDPENILESGIDIFVQPPGKKLQNMNLLSGGEKAMSACTLLFAMFLYRPTPFCFLDEIDAPLDDQNIDKFLKVVRTLSADTQFVIITHNQKTMAEADSLYGITMKEPGVSKILSVKLEQL